MKLYYRVWDGKGAGDELGEGTRHGTEDATGCEAMEMGWDVG